MMVFHWKMLILSNQVRQMVGTFALCCVVVPYLLLNLRQIMKTDFKSFCFLARYCSLLSLVGVEAVFFPSYCFV